MEMESRPKPTTGTSIYLDFEPSSEWVEDEKFETLLIHLPGYKKEQIKVRIDNSRNLRASGERPLAGNRWSRFRKDLRVPDTLNIGEIRAKFENGTLYIILPKLSTSAAEPPAPPQQPPSPPTPQKPVATDMTQKASTEAEEGAADQKQENTQASDKEDLTREPAEDVRKVEDGATFVGASVEKNSGDDARKARERVWGSATGLVMGMWKPEQLVVNVVVAVMVLLGLGIYVTYKVRKASAGES